MIFTVVFVLDLITPEPNSNENIPFDVDLDFNGKYDFFSKMYSLLVTY